MITAQTADDFILQQFSLRDKLYEMDDKILCKSWLVITQTVKHYSKILEVLNVMISTNFIKKTKLLLYSKCFLTM